MTASDHFIGFLMPIFGRMPLGCNFRCSTRQIVEPLKNLFSCTIRAAFTINTIGYSRLIVMPSIADPPHLSVGSIRNIRRQNNSIPLEIPLFAKFWMSNVETVMGQQMRNVFCFPSLHF